MATTKQLVSPFTLLFPSNKPMPTRAEFIKSIDGNRGALADFVERAMKIPDARKELQSIALLANGNTDVVADSIIKSLFPDGDTAPAAKKSGIQGKQDTTVDDVAADMIARKEAGKGAAKKGREYAKAFKAHIDATDVAKAAGKGTETAPATGGFDMAAASRAAKARAAEETALTDSNSITPAAGTEASNLGTAVESEADKSLLGDIPAKPKKGRAKKAAAVVEAAPPEPAAKTPAARKTGIKGKTTAPSKQELADEMLADLKAKTAPVVDAGTEGVDVVDDGDGTIDVDAATQTLENMAGGLAPGDAPVDAPATDDMINLLSQYQQKAMGQPAIDEAGVIDYLMAQQAQTGREPDRFKMYSQRAAEMRGQQPTPLVPMDLPAEGVDAPLDVPPKQVTSDLIDQQGDGAVETPPQSYSNKIGSLVKQGISYPYNHPYKTAGIVGAGIGANYLFGGQGEDQGGETPGELDERAKRVQMLMKQRRQQAPQGGN